MPTVPDSNQTISKESALNLLVASIGMEELALSHILNAEGEKLQYVLGTLGGGNPSNATIAEVLEVNKSVERMIKNIIKTEMLLLFKLEEAMDSIK